MLHLLALPALPAEIVERIAAGDDVLLQHQLVWHARQGHAGNAVVAALLSRPCRVFAMADTLAAHGIAADQLLPGVAVLDYPGLVALTVENPLAHTWC